MNKVWIYLVAIGVIVLVIVIGWDVLATVTGFKKDFTFSINPIQNRLYEPVESHLRSDPNFFRFQ